MVHYNQQHDPTVPTLLYPIDNEYTADNTTTFDWSDSNDPNSEQSVTYESRIFNEDSSLRQENISLSSSTITLSTSEALPDGKYNWTVRAYDGTHYSNWASNFTLTVDTILPDITLYVPSPLNTTIVNQSIGLNISCVNTNLRNVSLNITNSSNLLHSNSTDGLSQVTYWWNHTVDVSTWKEGNYTITVDCEDWANNTRVEDYNFTVDHYSPTISSLDAEPTSPVTYVYDAQYQYNATVTDSGTPVSEVIFEFGGTNYSYIGGQVGREGDEFYINMSDLAVGIYNYRWYANDTKDGWTRSAQQSYTVNAATPGLTLTLDGDSTSSQIRPYVNVTHFVLTEGNSGDSGCSYDILENGSSQSSVDYTKGLAARSYNITGYTDGCANYSADQVEIVLTVVKGGCDVNLWLNSGTVDADNTISYGMTANATTVLNVSGMGWTLLRNGSTVDSGTGVLNENVGLGVGTYNYTGNWSGNENYTSCYEESILSVIDTAAPKYWYNYTNNTVSGRPTLFSLNWTDDVGLSGYIFSTNNTGTWVNDSWTTMTGTDDWSNITDNMLNSTAGAIVQWRVYANDTADNWNASEIFMIKVIDGEAPKYWYSYSNNTNANEPTLFSMNWTDNIQPDSFIFSTNNTGTWTNDSAVRINRIINHGFEESVFYCGVEPNGWTNLACGDDYGYNQSIGGLFRGHTSDKALNIWCSGNYTECSYFEQYIDTSDIVGETITVRWWAKSDNSSKMRLRFFQGDWTPDGTYEFASIPNTYTLYNQSYVVSDSTTRVRFFMRTSEGNQGNVTIDDIEFLMANYTNFDNGYWTNASKILNSTAGVVVQWRMYANDTSNNWNASPIYTIMTVEGAAPQIEFISPTDENASRINRDWSYVNVSVTDISNTSSFVDWNRSLVGYWSMDWYNSTGVFDNSTWNNFANFGGGVGSGEIVDGAFGYGIALDGLDDTINVTPFLSYIPTAYTFEIWINPNEGITVDGESPGFIKDDDSDYVFRYNSGATWGRIRCDFMNTTDDTQSAETTTDYNLTTDSWYHLVCTWNGSSLKVYMNGQQIASSNTIGTPRDTFDDMVIGRYSPDQLNATVDEIRIYDRALSPEEIDASFNSGDWRLYHNFTNLTDGRYDYYAYSIDAYGNVNKTETQILYVDTIKPKYFDDSTNNTGTSQPTLFSLRWTDESGLDGYIFSTNNTGTWTNDSFVNFTLFQISSCDSLSDWVTVLGTDALDTGDKQEGDSSIAVTGDGTPWALITEYYNPDGTWDLSNYDSLKLWINPDTETDLGIRIWSGGDMYDNYIRWNGKLQGQVTAGQWNEVTLDLNSYDGSSGSIDMTQVTGIYILMNQPVGGEVFKIDDIRLEPKKESWSNVTKILNTTVGATVQWRVYANDTANNWNASDTYTIITTEGEPPKYWNASINRSFIGMTTLFSVNWTDNTGLSGYIFSTNNTGTWTNDTWTAFGGSPIQDWSNVTKTLNDTVGAFVQWRVYANDTYNNWNVTQTYSLTATNEMELDGCAVLDVGNMIYSLTTDISNSGTSACMNVTAINVTLDCNGRTIDGSDAVDSYGIYSNQLNTTITNCHLNDWDDSIYFSAANNSILYNVTTTSHATVGYSIALSGCHNMNITNVTVINTVGSFQYGITTNGDNNTFMNLFINTSRYGLYIGTSRWNRVINSTLLGLYDTPLDIWPPLWMGPEYCYHEFDNVVGKDNKPIVYVNDSSVIRDWYNNFSQIFICNADGAVFENITSSDNYGIRAWDSDNNNYTNIEIYNSSLSESAFFFRFCSGGDRLTNISYYNNAGGLVMYECDGKILTNVSVWNSGGIYVAYNSDNINITGGTFHNNTVDYSLGNSWPEGGIETNVFVSTNFTGLRIIDYQSATTRFNYNNGTYDNLWLRTNMSASAIVSRLLLSWKRELMKWNDTNISGPGITANYNLTGLLPSTSYEIYNNSELSYTLQTDSSGALTEFTIPLINETVVIVKEGVAPKYSDNSTNDTKSSRPTLFSVKWTDNFALSGYIFSTNNTGTWVNDTWQEWSWWDNNWQYKKSIKLAESSGEQRINEPVEMNISGLNLSTSSCERELRIVDSNNEPVEFQVLNSSNSSMPAGDQWCKVVFIANASANADTYYHAYYGNSLAQDPSYDDIITTQFDFENDTVSAEPPEGWTSFDPSVGVTDVDAVSGTKSMYLTSGEAIALANSSKSYNYTNHTLTGYIKNRFLVTGQLGWVKDRVWYLNSSDINVGNYFDSFRFNATDAYHMCRHMGDLYACTELNASDHAILNDTWYFFRTEYKGPEIRFWLNNSLLWYASNADMTNGTFGFRVLGFSTGQQMRVDDLKVYSSMGLNFYNDSLSATLEGEESIRERWSNVTKILNTTVDAVVQWRVYANDSVDNWNASQTYTLVVVDGEAPKYWDDDTNNTEAGKPTEFSLRWTDNTVLNGYIFSFDNGTGTFVNDSFVSMSGSEDWSNVTKVVSETVGAVIRWRVYANDTADNWNASEIFTFNTWKDGWVSIELDPDEIIRGGVVNISGEVKYTDNLEPINYSVVVVSIDGQTKCTDNTTVDGKYSCLFNAPRKTKVYQVLAKVTDSKSGYIISNTTNLNVLGLIYGEERVEEEAAPNVGCYQVPMLVQNADGTISKSNVRICVWK
jgi:hypothetical protein